MSVADLTLAAYALLTVVSIFGAGRLWGPGAGTDRLRRWLGTGFAAAQTVVLTYYLVWTDDRFHRASYIVMNAAVCLVVLSALTLILFSVRQYRRGPLFTIAGVVGILGLAAVGYTALARDLVWPPFAVFVLVLVLAPAAALVPRWMVAGYRPLRDPELFPWVLLAVLGLWGSYETVSMVGLVPGTAWFGRPSLLHFFVAGTVVVIGLAGIRWPVAPPPIAEGPIPWHLFNPPLSPREADLVAGLRRRLTNKELAAAVGVSESTVKKHLVSLFRKAGVESRQELFERLDGQP